ncbi:MAG: ComEC/Rec2 family competence protein [Clostridia bacterium]|nr:ComEC/Rec2 family competence protein [Clostridia bacterium]
MKRPLAIIGFTYLVSLFAAEKLPLGLSAAMAVFCALSAAAALLIKNFRRFTAVILSLVTACAAFSVFYFYNRDTIGSLAALYDTETQISGRVVSDPYTDYGNYYYIIKTDKIKSKNAPQNVCIRLMCGQSVDAGVSDIVTAKVHLYAPDGNGYASLSSNYAKGIQLYGYVYDVNSVKVSEQSRKDINYYFAWLRSLVRTKIRKFFTDDSVSALLCAMLLGDKSYLSDEVPDNFSHSGISHLLAVSGLHTVILVSLLFWLFGILGLKKKTSAAIACCFIFVFMGIVGFAPSVTRAGIMMLILMGAQLFYRESDALNSLGFACLIICAINPYAACDVGLLLSVSASLGLIVLTPHLFRTFKRCFRNVKNKHIKAGLYAVGDVFSQSAGATLFTLPVCVMSFGSVSAVAPLVNILCVYPATVFLWLAVIALLIPSLGIVKYLAVPFVYLDGLIAKYILKIADIFAGFSFSRISLNIKCLYIWMAATVILFIAAHLMNKGRKLYRFCAALSAVIFIVSLTSYRAADSKRIKIGIIDTNGGCAVAVIKNGQAVLLGCGGAKLAHIDVVRYLEGSNVAEIPLAVLPSLEVDYCRCAEKVMDVIKTKAVFMPGDGDRLDEILYVSERNNIKLYNIKDAACETLGGKLETFTDEINNTWLHFRFDGLSLLVAPEKGDAALLPEYMRACDILVLSSADIKSLDALFPAVTVIAADSKERVIVESQCITCGMEKIYSTDRSRSITFTYKGGKNLLIREEK